MEIVVAKMYGATVSTGINKCSGEISNCPSYAKQPKTAITAAVSSTRYTNAITANAIVQRFILWLIFGHCLPFNAFIKPIKQ